MKDKSILSFERKMMRRFIVLLIITPTYKLSAQDIMYIPGQSFALEIRSDSIRMQEGIIDNRTELQRLRGIYIPPDTVPADTLVLEVDSINAGSTLQRGIHVINFDGAPVRITDASADFISLAEIEPECQPDADEGRGFLERLFTVKPDCDEYAEIFLQSFFAETVAVQTVAAVEVRFITLDYFGDVLRDTRLRRVKDYSGTDRWYDVLSNHSDIYWHLNTIAVVNRVTLLDGSLWSLDERELFRIVGSLNINLNLEKLEEIEPEISIPLESDAPFAI